MNIKEKYQVQARKSFSLPLYLIVWILCTIVGFIESGLIGSIVGLSSGLFCSLFALTGLIPFAGIFVYWYAGHWMNGLLANLGIAAPFAQGIAFWFFFVFALIGYLFMTFLTIVVFLTIISRLLGTRKCRAPKKEE